MNLIDYIKSQLPSMPNVAIMKDLGASDELIEYIRKTPWNTNMVIVGEFGEGGENWNTLFEDEVTIVEHEDQYFTYLSISGYIDVDKIKITFNGVEYVCNKMTTEDSFAIFNTYGGSFNEKYEPDFSNYSFIVESMSDKETGEISNFITTEAPGTYSIKIETPKTV